MSIRAVVFDIGGVLERVGEREWADSWRARLGMGTSEFQAALDRVDPDGLIQVGRMSEEQYRRRYAEALGLTPEQSAAFMQDMWAWYCGELDLELLGFARSLRSLCRTAILSNSADGARREEQARWDFAATFDPIIYSHEVGLAKPDPRVYLLTCQRLDLQPSKVVLLDDVPRNVQGARDVGMHAVVHRATPESIAAIEELLAVRR